MRFLFIALLFASAALPLAKAEKFVQTEIFTSQSGAAVAVKFFAHNSPSIDEFVSGKNRMLTAIKTITDNGLTATKSQIEIGIAPDRMYGGNVLMENGKLYVSVKASDEELEGGLFNFYVYSVKGKLTFFGWNQPSISQFFDGKARVEATIQRFKDNELKLVLPKNLSVGIAPDRMYGGNIVEENGKVFISVKAEDKEIEGYFSKYIQ